MPGTSFYRQCFESLALAKRASGSRVILTGGITAGVASSPIASALSFALSTS
jgi:hypothetical protein